MRYKDKTLKKAMWVGSMIFDLPAHEKERIISSRYNGILAEQDGLSASPRNGKLCKYDACHTCLNYDTKDTLQTHDNDCKWTLFCGSSVMKMFCNF